MDADVLIVGAGPTGLMLANQLARGGVRVHIIDRGPGPSRQTRALGVQARTLEIYAALGVLDQALSLGRPATGAELWSQGRHRASVPLSTAGADITRHPCILILGQDDNEKILGDRLRGLGVSVQWETELVALDQRPDHVVARLRHADGRERELIAAWVAGCDGAHSAVRKLTGIPFPGDPYEHVFFVADVDVTGGMRQGEVNVYLWRDGFHLFFPMRGQDHWRIVGILPPALGGRDDARFEDVIPSILGEAGVDLRFGACSWFATYRIHHRAAARFREGRCFVLGDAAHIHSPVGAQGMNTGLQDAYNLGWKLALVTRGRAGEALLDSYEAERLPVARRLLATTDRAFRLIVADNPLAGLLRTRVAARIAAFAMRIGRLQRQAFRLVSQTGIHYRNSPLSSASDSLPGKGPRAGDRFPWMKIQREADAPASDLFEMLDDTRFNLIVTGAAWGGQAPCAVPGGMDGGMADMLRLHVIAGTPHNEEALRRAGIPPAAFYLLRPDGHVGFLGARLDMAAIGRYLRETVHWRDESSRG